MFTPQIQKCQEKIMIYDKDIEGRKDGVKSS